MKQFIHRTEIRAIRQPWVRSEIAISLARFEGPAHSPQIYIAEPIKLRALTEEDMMREHLPTFSLQPEDAQQFMDELWRCGIRPTEGAGSVGQLAATERHLADLQRLVFKDIPKQG